MLQDLFPALHSGHVYLPQVPVGTVRVKGRNTITRNRPTDFGIFPLYQKFSHHFWIYFSKDSSLALSQRSSCAHSGFYSQKGPQHHAECCDRGCKAPLPSACHVRSQPTVSLLRKPAQPGSLSPTC